MFPTSLPIFIIMAYVKLISEGNRSLKGAFGNRVKFKNLKTENLLTVNQNFVSVKEFVFV